MQATVNETVALKEPFSDFDENSCNLKDHKSANRQNKCNNCLCCCCLTFSFPCWLPYCKNENSRPRFLG